MRPKARARIVVWARRAVQTACLCLFFWLLWAARTGDEQPPNTALGLFFHIDPLILVGTWLSTHEATAAALLALITLVVTVLLGRVFCGWVCPLGTVHNAATWCRRLVYKRRAARAAWSPWQRAKYYVLVALLVMAVFGAHWIGVFDPISLLYRTTATALLPGAQYAIEDGSTAVYRADPQWGPIRPTSVTEPIYRFFRDRVFVIDRQVFTGGNLIFVLFVAIVLLNLYRPRFWCRYLCPLGALLGLCSKRPVLRLENQEGCTDCGLCAMRCPAAATPDKPGQWRSTECFGCWNCVAACNRDAIAFRFKSPLPAPSQAKLDLSKRAVLSAGVGGLAGLVTLRLTPQAQARTFNLALIRPPGARPEREFLQRCLQCGLCMKACPTNALQPTLFEAGIEGMWTPRLVPRIGCCEYNCNLCGQVCPTEAIQPLALEDKQKVKIGLASFDITRCIPYAYNRDCMVCEEHCPIPEKAIYFLQQEITLRDGTTRSVKQPHVDPDLCIGCGVCESVCVFKDRPAIRVTSVNETRHPANQAILPGLPQRAGDAGEPASQDPYGASSDSPY